METYKWLDLQLFAGEGAGDGGGEGATTGENAAVDAEQRLRELGVPEDKLRKRANRFAGRPAVKTAESSAPTADNVQSEPKDAASQKPTEETKPKDPAPTRMSWDEIMKDPEYNSEMQKIVRARVNAAGDAQEKLDQLAPALELLARKHGLDISNLDYAALSKAINDDDSYYEERALEMGVPTETAKKIDRQQRDTERAQRAEAMNLAQQNIQNHLKNLEEQGKELKKVYPSFDLREELKNPVFARMTSPGGGISVEDAYYAIHRKEIQAASMQAAERITAEKLSKSIQAGGKRPMENGTSGQASSVTSFDYSKASKSERDAFKKALHEAWARGEKVFPRS